MNTLYILHWQVQTSCMLNNIKHAHTQIYFGYCWQISYDSIVVFYKMVSQMSVANIVCLLGTTHLTYVTHEVTLLINIVLSKQVLIKVCSAHETVDCF